MGTRSWKDDWFRRLVPALTAVLVATFAAWLAAGQSVPTSDAPTTPPHRGQIEAPVKPVGRQLVTSIDEARGRVGSVRLGMSIDQVRAALGAKNVMVVQRPIEESRTFELFAPTAGLRLVGARGKIHTVTVMNSGAGLQYATHQGIRIGASDLLLTRRYTTARIVCGREWWVNRGKLTLRFTALHRKITMITVSNKKRPRTVDCS
jgi:hypothetical protein